jgi:hypothetical protein
MDKDIRKLRKSVSKIPIKSRMLIMQELGKKRYNVFYPENVDYKLKKQKPFNYELEYLSLLSVVVENRDRYTRVVNPNSWIHETVNIIRNQKYLNNLFETHDAFSAIAGMFFMQLQGQKGYLNLYYRYNYLYNFSNENIDIRDIFISKFKVDYNSFLDFNFLLSTYKELEQGESLKWFYGRINNDLKTVFDLLMSDRRNFVNKYETISSNDSQFSFFDLNLLLQYPIINYNLDMFIPWYPYVPYAITESLMFRLTQNNNDLRSIIGKEALESYVYDLFTKSKYNASMGIHREILYGREHKHTSDVIISNNNDVLLFEIKFISQSLALRELDDKEIETYTIKLAKGLVQLRQNIDMFEKGVFDSNIKCTCKRAKGVLLTYDEYYFHREELYKKAVDFLNIQGVEVNEEELKEQTIIVSLTNLENILSRIDDDILSYFYKELDRENSWVDFTYNYDNYSNDIEGLPFIKDFVDKYLDDFSNRIQKLIKLP